MTPSGLRAEGRMEAWLTKPRVLLALSAVMLAAALNRASPLFYGMFLFLLVLALLGLTLPWASMRRIEVRAAGSGAATEGESPPLALSVAQRGWCPAVMVEVETYWAWAGHETVLRHVVPMLRRHREHDLGSRMRFPCRGRYRLREVRLVSGFPLGLFTAHRSMVFPDIAFVVRPRPADVVVPDPLPISADERGLHVTRRLGNSDELGALREYEVGDPVGRIHWRASARAGHLVIQHHLQSGSPLVRLAVEIPGGDEVGRADAPSEVAVRVAAGWCLAAQAAGLRLRAYLPTSTDPLMSADAMLDALAGAEPDSLPLADGLGRAGRDLRDGELLVVIVGTSCPAAMLTQALTAIRVDPAQVLVCVAIASADRDGRGAPGAPVADAVQQAGYRVMSVRA